jgi:hypothetical protein
MSRLVSPAPQRTQTGSSQRARGDHHSPDAPVASRTTAFREAFRGASCGFCVMLCAPAHKKKRRPAGPQSDHTVADVRGDFKRLDAAVRNGEETARARSEGGALLVARVHRVAGSGELRRPHAREWGEHVGVWANRVFGHWADAGSLAPQPCPCAPCRSGNERPFCYLDFYSARYLERTTPAYDTWLASVLAVVRRKDALRGPPFRARLIEARTGPRSSKAENAGRPGRPHTPRPRRVRPPARPSM